MDTRRKIATARHVRFWVLLLLLIPHPSTSQSARAPDALTTFAHFCISDSM